MQQVENAKKQNGQGRLEAAKKEQSPKEEQIRQESTQKEQSSQEEQVGFRM